MLMEGQSSIGLRFIATMWQVAVSGSSCRFPIWVISAVVWGVFRADGKPGKWEMICMLTPRKDTAQPQVLLAFYFFFF